jgi:DnaK suppressor protein
MSARRSRDPGPAAPLDLEAVGEALRTRDAELRGRIGTLAQAPERGSTLGFGKRIGDGTIEAVGRLTEVGVGETLELEQARVARAIEKLDEDSYGTCDSCGASIAPRRLAAMPESTLCLTCAGRLRR